MRFVFGRKVVLSIVFIVLAVVGTFFVKSPVDSMPLFTIENLMLVVGTAFGITFAAKAAQKARLEKRPIPPYVTVLEKIWALLDPTAGAITAVASFLLATFLVYYRLVDFTAWFSYHAIFLVYFDTVNVAKK
jgi:hypothetical protein